MSILRKQMSRDPEAGYARDFVELVERILPEADMHLKKLKTGADKGAAVKQGHKKRLFISRQIILSP